MQWRKKDEVPPLSKGAIGVGNKDGGWSVPLFFLHKSGKFSTGQALLHGGKVAYWYPGEFGASSHSPETCDSPDPIVKWVICPSVEQVVEALTAQWLKKINPVNRHWELTPKCHRQEFPVYEGE
jgi:hypothetical protein